MDIKLVSTIVEFDNLKNDWIQLMKVNSELSVFQT